MERTQLLNNIARCIFNSEGDATVSGRILSLRNALSFANKLSPSEFKGQVLGKIFRTLNRLRRRAVLA